MLDPHKWKTTALYLVKTIPDKSFEINFLVLSHKLTPIWFISKDLSGQYNTIIYTVSIILKLLKIWQGSNLTYTTIWFKKKLGVRKSREFPIFRPLYKSEKVVEIIMRLPFDNNQQHFELFFRHFEILESDGSYEL